MVGSEWSKLLRLSSPTESACKRRVSGTRPNHGSVPWIGSSDAKTLSASVAFYSV
jgi:hypothetical protein